jgi:hypothetical protein
MSSRFEIIGDVRYDHNNDTLSLYDDEIEELLLFQREGYIRQIGFKTQPRNQNQVLRETLLTREYTQLPKRQSSNDTYEDERIRLALVNGDVQVGSVKYTYLNGKFGNNNDDNYAFYIHYNKNNNIHVYYIFSREHKRLNDKLFVPIYRSFVLFGSLNSYP